MAGGLMAAFGIVSALLQRELGGSGQYLDVSMTDVVLSFGTGQEWAGTKRRTGEEILDEFRVPPVDMVHPNYGIYETKDGEFITISAVEEKFCESLLKVLGREDLREYRHAHGERGDYATEELQSEFATRTRREWEEVLSDEIPFAQVNEFHEVIEHPQVEAREMVKTTSIGGETVEQFGFPMKSSEDIKEALGPGPDLGEHTVEVFERVLSHEDIERLLDAEVLHQA